MRRMKIEVDKWVLINELAESLGVPYETRKKWRIRGVPAAWQIRFVQARPESLSFDDFGTSVLIPQAQAGAAE
jgi:hypothetical protein